MKKLLIVLAVALTLTLALGICGKTDAKAGGSNEMLITDYEPVCKVEADSKNGKIKLAKSVLGSQWVSYKANG